MHKPFESLIDFHISDTISAAVTDGVTVGHPCCNERDCKIPLDKVTDEYCGLHQNLGAECCIQTCVNPCQVGYRTCHMEAHRKEERRRAERGRRKPKMSKGKNMSGVAVGDAGEGAEGAESVETTTLNEGRSVVKGVFSRRWTHNEQLMVRPCGIVIGRATFFSAESMTGVKVCLSRNILDPHL